MVSTLATKKTASESKNPESLNFLKVRELVKISIGNSGAVICPNIGTFLVLKNHDFRKSSYLGEFSELVGKMVIARCRSQVPGRLHMVSSVFVNFDKFLMS